jgi:hypothetical protein
MHNLTIVGTEDGALVLASESGERFLLPINEVLRREIQRSRTTELPRSAAVSPREIQSHIRAGLTVAEAAELLNVPIEDVTRFAGPVIAEREHVINQAFAAPVILGNESDLNAQPTFGAAIRQRLNELDASQEHWASWKDDRSWMIKLEFVANEISHDARWSFDPRNGMLAPSNDDAIRLSSQGASSEGLIPRLRALDADAQDSSPYKDESRFDSGAFRPRPELAIAGDPEPERSSPAVQEAAMSRAPEEEESSGNTADLLDALRRRRGQREGLPFGEDEQTDRPTAPIALFEAIEEDSPTDIAQESDSDFDIQIDDFLTQSPRPDSQRPSPSPAEPTTRRRGRETLPPWDEIVFGTRSDD